ncbi:hypothetical protein [Candidatus Binatus soli]|jgi:hypothetical protein|uniref:hypothetical protein n=1 Tax=Candidatus Binatus soli TaxID=1953413 RepID=UPI003D0EFBB6
MPLNPQDRAAIQSLSRANVQQTFGGLKRFTKKSVWVGKNNRYTTDVIKQIALETRTGALNNPRQLSQYISASCLLHCSDGWSYLGKSISALLRGDPHRSRHLAYYAELRAAMSLLASVGIGVFNNRHFVIDAPDSVVRLRGKYPTHEFVWDCLEAWGADNMSGDLFARVVRPNGRTLDEWLQPIGGGSKAAPQARQWFLQWGMDLKMPVEDKSARNESSYRPDGMPDSWCLDTSDTLRFTREMWSALEPSAASRFDTIDRHILRIAVESIFKGQTQTAPSKDPTRFRKFVSQVVEGQGFSTETAAKWVSFLHRQEVPDNLSILDLSQQSSEIRATSHTAIVARAALLLRIASGSTVELLSSIGFTADSVSFWWKEIGSARGLWDGEKGADGLIDLWADIKPLLQDIDDFQRRTQTVDQTFFRVGSDLGHTLAGLGSFERVAIWSLTPS